MCRFLVYASAAPESVADLLEAEELERFRRLSRLHADGWGMAWVSEEGDGAGPPLGTGGAEGPTRLRSARSTRPAHTDPLFDSLVQRRLGQAGFAHLRWATSGLAITEANTHPFLAGGWAFAHQGSIPAPERLETLLAPEFSARLQGATDSECYFLYVLQCLAGSASVVSAVGRAVRDIVAACGPASLNAVLLSDSSLVVVHGCAGLEPPREDLLAAVASPEEMPADHLVGYYDLWYCRREEAVLVASSGFASGGGWEAVPDETIVHVDIATRQVSLTSFAGAPVGR